MKKPIKIGGILGTAVMVIGTAWWMLFATASDARCGHPCGGMCMTSAACAEGCHCIANMCG